MPLMLQWRRADIQLTTPLPYMPCCQQQEKDKYAKAEDLVRLLDALLPCMWRWSNTLLPCNPSSAANNRKRTNTPRRRMWCACWTPCRAA